MGGISHQHMGAWLLFYWHLVCQQWRTRWECLGGSTPNQAPRMVWFMKGFLINNNNNTNNTTNTTNTNTNTNNTNTTTNNNNNNNNNDNDERRQQQQQQQQQTNKPTNQPTNKQTNKKQTNKQKNKQTNKQTNRQTNKQTDKQTTTPNTQQPTPNTQQPTTNNTNNQQPTTNNNSSNSNNNNNAYNWLVLGLPLRKKWKSVGMILPNMWKNKTCSKPPTTTFMSFKGLRSCLCQCGSLFTEDYCFSIPFCRYPTCYAQKQVIPEVCFFGPHRLAPSFFEKPHPRRTWTSLFLSLSLTIINYH